MINVFCTIFFGTTLGSRGLAFYAPQKDLSNLAASFQNLDYVVGSICWGFKYFNFASKLRPTF